VRILEVVAQERDDVRPIRRKTRRQQIGCVAERLRRGHDIPPAHLRDRSVLAKRPTDSPARNARCCGNVICITVKNSASASSSAPINTHLVCSFFTPDFLLVDRARPTECGTEVADLRRALRGISARGGHRAAIRAFDVAIVAGRRQTGSSATSTKRFVVRSLARAVDTTTILLFQRCSRVPASLAIMLGTQYLLRTLADDGWSACSQRR
jgi:hypothetical protein